MSGRFYFAWGLAVLLALVLPVAVPYAIWPPGAIAEEGRHADGPAECGRRAKIDARNYTHFSASMLPLSSDVERCYRPPGGDLIYTAKVTAHGPYGIPIASTNVGPTGGGALTGDGRASLFAMLALVSGAVLVSMPFALLAVRSALRPRLGTAS
ncbi:MAG: hypothetical protein WD939_04985 [Dehalococcoidia bacterium]